MQNEFYVVAFRKKIYSAVEELQEDINKWLKEYNSECSHTGRYCYGKTSLQIFIEAKYLAQEKMIGENKISLQEKIEIKPKKTMAEKMTTSELESVR